MYVQMLFAGCSIAFDVSLNAYIVGKSEKKEQTRTSKYQSALHSNYYCGTRAYLLENLRFYSLQN